MVFDIEVSSRQHYRYWEIITVLGNLEYSHSTVRNERFFASFDTPQGEIQITPKNSKNITANKVIEVLGAGPLKRLIERFIEFGCYLDRDMLPSEMITNIPNDSEVAIRAWAIRKRALEANNL